MIMNTVLLIAILICCLYVVRYCYRASKPIVIKHSDLINNSERIGRIGRINRVKTSG